MKLNQLLGIEFPIIQGGMANIATGTFAAAVSNAGGLGLIATGGMDGQKLRDEILTCKSLTEKPFGVNLMLLNPKIEELAQVVIDERIAVITTGAGNPAQYMKSWNDAGIKVIPVVPSVSLARMMEKRGAYAVIAEGTESGGHVGEISTMALVPQVVDAVSIPVIAAGGIADGRQFMASILLGACGVQVGTCLLVAEECPVHANYKAEIIKAKDTSTIVTGRSVGVPVRVLKNPMSRAYVKLEATFTDKMELEAYTLGSLRRAVFDGDVKMGSLMAGQVAGQLKEIRTVREIFTTIMEDSISVRKRVLGDYES